MPVCIVLKRSSETSAVDNLTGPDAVVSMAYILDTCIVSGDG